MKFLILILVIQLATIVHCQVGTCSLPNEVYNDCGNRCKEPTCEVKMTLVVCDDVCDAGCFCKPGFLRDVTGQCVVEKKCLKNTCLKNEVVGCAIPCCEAVCNTPIRDFCTWIKRACTIQCVCKDGYILAEGNGPRRCKPITQCR